MTHTHRPHSKLDILRRTIFITIGAVIMALGLEAVLIPNSIIDGGVVGISIMLSHVTGLGLGVFLFILNIPFFFLGYKQIGKTFALSTLYGIIVLSISTSLLHDINPLLINPTLAMVFGGIVIGVGIGIVIRNGGALDGTEILAILAEKKIPFSVGEIIMIMNAFIFTVAVFVFGLESALYSMITYFIAFKTIDLVMVGLSESKQIHVISDEYRDIGEAIVDRLGRGVTYLHGEGGFTGEQKHVIMCVINRLEEAKLKEIVDEFDHDAFVTIADIAEVRGGRFNKHDIH